MNINNVEFGADCYDIIRELQTQLYINNIQLISKIIDTPNNVQICCPYHKRGQERRPSAGIKKTDGTFHCLACGEVHTLSEVISYCFGHTEDILGKFGWQWLLKNFATISVEERKDVDLDFSRCNIVRGISNTSGVNSCVATGISCDQFVSEEELDKYRYYHPYWRKRGIVDERIIELFDLGFDKDSDCITMPVRDTSGKCVFVARRSVKTKWFNYPQGVHKPIYGLYEYNLEREKLSNMFMCTGRGCGKTYMMSQIQARFLNVFICESMIDALLLWQSGFFAFALNGLGSEPQIAELKKLPIRSYILCTDNDEAGRKARKELRKKLGDSKILTEIDFPKGIKDVGECTREQIDNILDWEVM